MKRIQFFFFIAIAMFLFSSCRFTKDLAYFQDLATEQSLFGIPKEVPEYRIRPLDNLYVNIQTLDKDVNELFNSSPGSENYVSGTEQMYGGLPSQYINGYMVEASGEITFPIIGTIPVSGLTLIEAQSRIKERAM